MNGFVGQLLLSYFLTDFFFLSASYLPQPSAVRYEFRYIDKAGQVCARSRPFTFCLPKPLGELETLKDEEDGEEELLLVVPRAQLLQVRTRTEPGFHCLFLAFIPLVHDGADRVDWTSA